MEKEIMKLLKSNNSEDNFLGVILAMKELGEPWCKKTFHMECNHDFPDWKYREDTISVIKNEDFAVNIKYYPTYEGKAYETTEEAYYIYCI